MQYRFITIIISSLKVNNIKWKIVFVFILLIILILAFIFYANSIDIRTEKIKVKVENVLQGERFKNCDIKIIKDLSNNVKIQSKNIPGIYVQLTPYVKENRYNFKMPNFLNKRCDTIYQMADVIISKSSISFWNTPRLDSLNESKNEKYYRYLKLGHIRDTVFVSIDSLFNCYDTNFRYTLYWKDTTIVQPNEVSVIATTDIKTSFWHSFNTSSVCLLLEVPKIYSDSLSILFDFKAPMHYDEIYPEPDLKTSSTLTFYNKDKIKYINQHGIFIYGYSITKQQFSDMKFFVLASFIGFLSSMIFSLIFSIIKYKFQNNKG